MPEDRQEPGHEVMQKTMKMKVFEDEGHLDGSYDVIKDVGHH
jgi:hypothetical protein